MRKKRVMITGAGKSGKTTIAGWLDETTKPVSNLANIRYGLRTIDIPGAYLECPWMHRHLINCAGEACCVLMLADQSRCRDIYPPGFARVFRIPVLGVITKSNQCPNQRPLCEQQLKRAGVMPPYYTITDEEESFGELKALIMNYLR